MEAHDQRTVVSQRERSDKFTNLAKQLNFSEENSWKDWYRGCDRAQKLRTDEWLRHYSVQQAGHMDRHHALYSQQKQSQYQRFVMEPEGTRWEDRESTSEYDTDINETVEKLTDELQVMIDGLRDLQSQQPPEAEPVSADYDGTRGYQMGSLGVDVRV